MFPWSLRWSISNTAPRGVAETLEPALYVASKGTDLSIMIAYGYVKLVRKLSES